VENIRVYKSISPGGHEGFALRYSNSSLSTEFTNLKIGAKIVKKLIRQWQNRGYLHVSIDFSPYHDIEYNPTSEVQLCKPLSEEEKKEFWKNFSKIK